MVRAPNSAQADLPGTKQIAIPIVIAVPKEQIGLFDE